MAGGRRAVRVGWRATGERNGRRSSEAVGFGMTGGRLIAMDINIQLIAGRYWQYTEMSDEVAQWKPLSTIGLRYILVCHTAPSACHTFRCAIQHHRLALHSAVPCSTIGLLYTLLCRRAPSACHTLCCAIEHHRLVIHSLVCY